MVMIQARRTGKKVSLAKYWYPWKHNFWRPPLSIQQNTENIIFYTLPFQFYSAKYWKQYFLMSSSTYLHTSYLSFPLVFLPSCTDACVWGPYLRSWRSRIVVGTASQWLGEREFLWYICTMIQNCMIGFLSYLNWKAALTEVPATCCKPNSRRWTDPSWR